MQTELNKVCMYNPSSVQREKSNKVISCVSKNREDIKIFTEAFYRHIC